MVLAVFAAYVIHVLNLFYGEGATAYDAGWFAYILSHFAFPPPNPQYLIERGIPSFFAFHIAPLMPVWGGMAQLLHLSPAASFGAWQGFFHALLALLGVAMVRTPFSPAVDLACRIGVGLALAFSSICLNAMLYLHHELAIPILFIATCIALARSRPWLAVLLLVLTLSVRTDAGFHAALYFGAFAVAEWLTTRRITPAARTLAIFAAVSFAYSVAAFACVHYFFPQFDNFKFSYAGDHYNHFSLGFLGDRFVNLLQRRPELFVIFGCVLGMGIARRNLHLVLGALVIIPWTLLNLSGVRDVPGELYTYYAFPYLMLLAWPLLVPMLQSWAVDPAQRRAPAVLDRGQLAGWAAMSVLSWIVYFVPPFAHDPVLRADRSAGVRNFLPQIGSQGMQEVSDVAARLHALMQSSAQPVLVDEGFASLLPDTKREHIFKVTRDEPPSDRPFVLAYFVTQVGAIEIEAAYGPRAELCYILPRTNVRILTRGTAPAVVSAIAPSFTAAPCSDAAFAAVVR